jgi:hypothetical protein
MLITSMGIFGFLSKAHMDQNITVGDSAAQVQILDEKIKTEQDNITTSKRALQQMDAQVDQMLGRTTDDKGANRAVQIRKNQAKERKSLQADITAAQKNISALQAERAPLAAQNRKIEAEVGPIKYIAALIYGDNPDANLLERAVRWVIILLVFVFDPLALILILAAEQTIAWARKEREERKGWHQEWVPDTEAWPEWDDEITEDQLDAIKETANVEDVVMTEKLFATEEEFFAHGQEIARELDQQAEDRKPFDFSKHPYLTKPLTWFKREDDLGLVPKQEPKVEDPLDIPVLEGEEMWAQTAIDGASPTEQDLTNAISLIAELQAKLDVLQAEHDAKHDELTQLKSVDPVNLTDHLGNPIATYYPQQVTIPDLSITATINEQPTNAGFGTDFPKNPNKGDVYLRVDYLPSRLYKWNDKKWIEIDKETTDRYAYDEEYIKHLVERIRKGEYDYDLLSTAEQEQIERYLNGTSI